MKVQTLQTAVLALIQELERAGDSFTAHNITKRIRQLVNAQNLTISGLSVFVSTPRQLIPHTDVKAIVDELFDNELINFDRELKNGTYFLYSPKGPKAGAASMSAALKKAIPFVLPVNKISVKPAVSLNLKSAGRNQSTVSSILQYLENKKARNQNPTLKNIQSRLKGDKVSLDQIRAIVIGHNYTLQTGPTLSSSIVVL